MTEAALRAEMTVVMERLDALGLNRGCSGNLSVRFGDGFLITPSGVPPAQIDGASIVAVGGDGEWDGAGRPSSEWPLHRDVYAARRDVGAIVHVHSPFAVALACVGRDIPAFHYMIAIAGGDTIRCAPYATFGSAELGRLAVAALEGRRACLLANHGMVTVETDLEGAFGMAIEVEALAEQYWRALQIGEPVLLDSAEMKRVVDKFTDYKRGT
ncbi:MAG: class II aldolase [Alphaproteobacteria bacterium]|nr:class II aldolase [Alphaproteobacteria bacterium]